MSEELGGEVSLPPLPPSTDDLALASELQEVTLSPQLSRTSTRSGVSLNTSQAERQSQAESQDAVLAEDQPRTPVSDGASPHKSLSPSPGTRNLTPSRSPSPSPSALQSRSDNEAGPSRSPSLRGHRSPSPSASPSRLSSPPLDRDSPRPVPFHFPKPTLPTSTPVIVTEDNAVVVDEAAPFESIPLQTTPPPVPHSATLPSSPNLHPGSPPSRKRRSWNGFAAKKTGEAVESQEAQNGQNESVDPNSRSSISSLPRSQSRLDLPQGDSAEQAEGSSSPRRLHAPPAHPHPYPLPTPGSPPPVDTHARKPSQPQSHPAALGVKGSSTFEKVISHTRPSWLPPKDRVEDETHYHQWEDMMAQARKHEEEKRKQDEARRVEREKRLAVNTPKWEEMLDEKTFSAEKIRADPILRGIWFEGAPTYLRGKAWSLAIGNPLALSKDAYKSCVTRSRKAIDSGRFPPDILERLDKDLDGTLVHLRLFQATSPLRADLHELICAWVVYRSDTAMGYAPYITYLGALFLLSSPPATAFLSLVNLLSRPVLRAFYTDTQDEIDAFYRVFENLQADMFPKIFANCKNLGLQVPQSWFRTLLVEQVPFEAACRLLDQIVLDGDGYIFRAALAIFGFLEPRLYFPDRDEIESVLEGRNSATAAIIEREKERARLRGETYQEDLDGKLSVFGLNEHALFDWLKDDGWREARFERLVTREMPD